MKARPWPIIILALMHVLAPVGNFFFNALRLNHSMAQQWQYWFEIYPKPLLLASLLSPILAGVFIYLCKRWSYFAYLVMLAVIFGINFYAYSTSATPATLITLIVVLLIDLLAVAYFVVPSVQKIYMDPRMRWWEAAPRFYFNQDGSINGQGAVFKNLSQGGLLATHTSLLPEGSEVQIEWIGIEPIQGKIVYSGPIRGEQSMGIQFSHNSESKRLIEELTKKLHAEGQIVKERLPGPEDAFIPWLKRLLTTGKGLI